MFKTTTKRLLTLLLVMLLVASAMPLQMIFAATTNNLLDGQVTVTDSLGNGSLSGDTVTIKAAGNLFSKKTNTVTVTNNSGSKATLKFDYSASTYNSFTLNGAAANATGTYNELLDANATVTFVITSNSGFSNTTATLKLSGFSLTVAADSSDVTFNYDSSLGSITVGGSAVATGEVVNVTLDGIEIIATPVSGASFLGWINAEDGSILSSAATYTLKPATNITVKAVFIGSGSAPHFMVGTGYIFDNLNSAVSVASAAANKTVALMNNSTLPAGNYTIPSGVTLLIPFDAANTLYTTTPGLYPTENSFKVTPTVYRKLTMANGANITVNGAISVSAQTNASGGNKVGAGSPVGPCGFIDMNSGSSITVNNGAALYAWGFIIGSGNITAKSGAKVYENFQMQDFRGGSAFSNLKNEVFTTSQYYVQNIEVPLTLESGATEYSYTAINASFIGSQGSAMAFISNKDAMFNLTSGSVTKRYDGATDRLIIEADGDVTVSPVTLKISIYSLNSSDYILPINNNITLTVNSGTINISQDIAILPGTEIIIGENATCNLASGVKAIVYDSSEWGNYCGASNKKLIPVQYAPSKKYTRTEADLKDGLIQIDGTIDASKGYVYTTASGANVFSSGSGKAVITEGTETVTYQVTQSGSDISAYNEIAITPAKLKNTDGTYTNSFTGTFTYENGKWNGVCATHTYTDVVTAPTCTAQGYTTHTCSRCGHTVVDTYVDPVGHSYSDWKVRTAAGCETDGVEYRTCSGCGTEETKNIKATGHSYTDVVTAPTCTEEGYTTHTCANCNNSYTDSYVAATGHSFGDWEETKAPTCTETGEKHRVCATCSAEEKDAVAATGHSYTDVVTAPTCTEEGYTTHNCSACDHSYVDTVVEAAGHSYADEFTVDKAASHSEEGSKSRHCANCDSITDVTAIPVLVPDVDGDGSEPDALDLVELRKVVLAIRSEGDGEIEEAPAAQVDINDDGYLDIRDLIRLKRYIAGTK